MYEPLLSTSLLLSVVLDPIMSAYYLPLLLCCFETPWLAESPTIYLSTTLCCVRPHGCGSPLSTSLLLPSIELGDWQPGG
jgi:hypothetical protein